MLGLILGGFLLRNQGLTADGADRALGQAGSGAGSLHSGNDLGGMSLSGLRQLTLKSNNLGMLGIVLTYELLTGSVGAVGFLHTGGLPVMAQSLDGLGFGVVAVGALQNFHAVLFTGGGLGGLLVNLQLMLQHGAGDLFYILLSAADSADKASLGVGGAGSIYKGLFVVVLTGGGQDLFLGRVTLGAAPSDLAILGTGSVYPVQFHGPVMTVSDNLVAQVLAAELALHSGNTSGGAGGFLQNGGFHRHMLALVLGGFLLLGQNLAADGTLAALGQASLGAVCGNGGNGLGRVALGGHSQGAFKGNNLGMLRVVLTHELLTGRIGAVSFLHSGRLPLVAQSGNFLGLGVVAAGALLGLNASLLAGGSQGVLFIGNHIVTQGRVGDLHGLTGSAADGADLADLCVLRAGGINGLAIYKGMLAGGGQDLFFGLVAVCASIGDLAVLAAGGVLTGSLYPLVTGRDDLVAQALAANLADVLANAGSGAGSGLQGRLPENGHVGVLVGLGLVVLEGVITAGALVQGVAAFLTGSGDHSLLHIVTQSRDGSVALDDLGLGIVAAGASVHLTGTLGAGGIFKLAGGLQVMTQGRNLLLLQVLLTVVAVQDLFARLCTGCFFYSLPMGILMLTIRRDFHFGSEGGSGQHGDHHHQRQKSSKDFPLHDITSIEI